MPEVLIYGPMYQYSAEAFINAMNEAGDGDLTVRINSEGGSPEYGWGMVAKFSEHKGNKLVKVDGQAHSMALYYLCYANDAEALDVSQFTLHRAAYAEWWEKSDYMTAAMWDGLNSVNKKLRAALESKIDVAKLEALKGIKLDDVFSTETRLDVKLNAKEAKQIGLINRVVSITPAKKAEISSLLSNISTAYNDQRIAALGNPETEAAIETEKNKNPIKMDINKLKAEHADVYAAAVAIGVEQEKDRTGAWMAFSKIDPAAVVKGIEEGKEVTAKVIAEFSAKAMSPEILANIAKGNPAVVKTEEITAGEKTEKEKALASFEAAVDKNLKINKTAQ